MTEIERGAATTLVSQWYEYSGGPAADVSSLTITITDADGTVLVGPTSTGVTHVATGVYTYLWSVSLSAALGGCTIVWEGVDAQADDVTATEVVTVIPSTSLSHSYCTVDQLRVHLGDTGALLDQDLLERAITATSSAVDKYCSRRFWQDPTATTRTYRPDDTGLAWVHDISTTTGLIIKTDTAGDGTYATTWASTDYELEPEDAEVKGWPWWRIRAVDRYTFLTGTRRRSLQITAKFGWAAIPDDVEEACLLRAAAIFKRNEAIFGVAGFGDMGVVRIGRQDPDVVELLHPYRRDQVVAV